MVSRCILLFVLFGIVRSIRIDPLSASDHRLLDDGATASVNAPQPSGPDDHLVVEALPLWKGDPFPTKHWAGHLPASDSGDKYLFYWLFAPELTADQMDADVPLIIWLNGGPGCSSMDGLFIENGPFQLQKDEQDAYYVTSAQFSWHKTPAYTMYIDQPVGTGLSFTTSKKYPTNDEEVNIDFYAFLQSFFKLHQDKFVTEKIVNREVYFSGESHSGTYTWTIHRLASTILTVYFITQVITFLV
jgi:carboxypeptidase C (cathepsin A)